MQATVIKPILHKYLINDNFSHDSYIWEQRVWLWLHSPNSDSDLSVNDTYKLPIKFGNCGKCQRSVSLNCGKSFFLELASDSDFFSQKKKKTSDSDLRVNDMDKSRFKVWKVLLYY